MRSRLVLPLVLVLAACPMPTRSHAGSRWPDTRAGRLAQGWVGAFAAGEDSMRRFLAAHVTPARLAERSLASRLERYRELREQYGRLQLDAVTESAPLALTARLLDADARPHEFEFRARAEGPCLLESVKVRQNRFLPHGFGGFHH